MIAVMDIIVLDVYMPRLVTDPFALYPVPYPVLLHFSCRWYIYTCTCIHDLRIMYTYILYIHICIFTSEETRIKKKEIRREIHIMYMYACLFRQERPTINHAKFFAQFIRVADTKYVEIQVFC